MDLIPLYHGSTLEVRAPKILTSLKTSDFGTGFYTTSSLSQASEWARTKRRRRRKGQAMVSFYKFDRQQAIRDLEILEFSHASADWLDFVVANRLGAYKGKKYDLIIGPVADDRTITVLDNYMDGLFSKKMAIELLEPQNLHDQYAFLTHKSLFYLTFTGVDFYEI